jgi:hypothetical protein
MRHIAEQPHEHSEGDSLPSHRALVDEVVRWVFEPELPAFGVLYGPRGSGKTSLLLEARRRVHAAAARDEEAAGDRLPKIRLAGELFAPEELADSADLIAALVRHLEGPATGASTRSDRRGPPPCHLGDAPGGPDGQGLWDLLARRASPGEFRELDKTLASSPADLERRLVRAYRERSELHDRIRACVHAWIAAFVARDPQPGVEPRWPRLLLVIDDLDLVHHRAWELLDCLFHCFQHPALRILIAADEALLDDGLASGIQALDPRLPADRARALAAAMRQKRLPVRFSVPVLSVEEKLDLLRAYDAADGDAGVGPYALAWPVVEGATPAAAAPSGHSPSALRGLGPALPESPRAIKALRNALIPASRALPSDQVAGEGRTRLQQRWLLEAAHLIRPDLQLPTLWAQRGRSLLELLRRLEQRDPSGWTRGADEDELAHMLSGVGEVDRPGARGLLRGLMRQLDALDRENEEIRRRLQSSLLRVLVYADEPADEAVRAKHLGPPLSLDLRAHRVAEGQTLPPQAVVAAWGTALDQLEGQPPELALSGTEPAAGCGPAPLSLLAALGWRLRRTRLQTWYNPVLGRLVRYEGALMGPLPRVYRGGLMQEQPGLTSGASSGAPDAVLAVCTTEGGARGVLDRLPEALWPEVREARVLRWRGDGFIPTADEDQQRSEAADVPPNTLMTVIAEVLRAAAELPRAPGGTLHLLLQGPAPLAFFLGGHLHTLRPVQLYELSDGRYVPTIRLDAGPPEAAGGAEAAARAPAAEAPGPLFAVRRPPEELEADEDTGG